MIVFYSWQSDLPDTKTFVRKCLEAAIERLNQKDNLIEAERDEPTVDRRRHSAFGA